MRGEAGTRSATDWRAEGRRIGASFQGIHSVVVAGVDPTATALLALGVAEIQAERRRVAVADLLGDAPPFSNLISAEDRHGVVDSFTYGVSLNKIAHLVPGTSQLFLLPTGTEPPDYEELLPNPRWRRLASGFREVGALLIIAAPALAPQLAALLESTDGAVLVGDRSLGAIPPSQVIATVRGNEPTAAPAVAGNSDVQRPRPRRSRALSAAVAGLLLTLALAGGALWLAYRPLAQSYAPLWLRRRLSHTTSGASPNPGVALSRADSDQRLDTAVVPSGTVSDIPTLANPGDTADAAPFAVELMAANTEAGAILKLQQDGRLLPAATFGQTLIQGASWYKVFSGAFSNAAQADSLLLLLRQRHVLDSLSGTVTRVPYAFLIDSAVDPASVPSRLAAYANHDPPVYALRQSNGTARLYAGAFESVDQAATFADSLRSAGMKAVLVYRKGRNF